MYTKPLDVVIRTHGLHRRHPGVLLYISFKLKDDVAQHEALTHIESCLKDTESWTNNKMLKLNADKTEVILYYSRHNSKKHGYHFILQLY